MEYKRLSECADYRSERTSKIDFDTYISTENMLPDKGGITTVDSLPDVKTTSKYYPDDILLSNIRPYFRKIWLSDRVGGCSNDVLVVTAKKDYLPRFLYYVLSDNNFFNYDTVTSKGTKMPRGTPKAIMKYLVPDVSKSYQEKVVTVLSSYDDLINANNKRIKALEQMAENLYKEWFVRFRFPGHETAEFENGIPTSWVIDNLGNIMKFGSGKAKPSSEQEAKYPVYGGNGITDWCNSFNDEYVLIIGRVGAYCGSVYYVPDKCWISDNALFAKRIENLRGANFFDFFLLKSLDLNSRQGGTGQPLITQGLLSKIKLIIPLDRLIEQFGYYVKDCFETIRILKLCNDNLIKQRDLLLPRMMSGKLEV